MQGVTLPLFSPSPCLSQGGDEWHGLANQSYTRIKQAGEVSWGKRA